MLPPTLEWTGGAVRLIDQRALPGRLAFLEIKTPEQMWDAIKTLAVRGAPAIGCAAAYGVVLGVQGRTFENPAEVAAEVRRTADYLATSRPTAVNLFWALDRMRAVTEAKREPDTAAVLQDSLLLEALAIHEEDRALCAAIGRHGAELVPDGASVLTHCNAGALATGGSGTALAVIYTAHEQGKKVRVYADETRPLLQGARLTAWELQQSGVPVTLICDNMAAHLMKLGRIDLCITGADRIAANGDAANKIGTYAVALAAAAHGIPFYVAAPYSTVDLALSDGSAIPIEERDPAEVTAPRSQHWAPEGVAAANPAFDVTPARLIKGIITEKGVLAPPYGEALRNLLASRP